MATKRVTLGLQFWPWYDVKTLAAHAKEAVKAFPFDQLWMCDEFQYEDTLTVLAILAEKIDASLGTMVTFPWRNPLELAQRFATISELMNEGREIAVGIGVGGAVQEQVIAEKTNPVAVVEETIRLLRGLFAGTPVELGNFPRLAERFRYNTRAKARLYFPPKRVPVYLAAGGEKVCEIAGRVADGVIITQIHPRTSLVGMRTGMFGDAVQAVENARTQSGDMARPFTKIYKLSISVSNDGHRAKQWAKRNTSYAVATYVATYPTILKMSGIDMSEAEKVREAYVNGLGVEEGARRVSDELLEKVGFIVAGTPAECKQKCEEIISHVRKFDFDHIAVGVPLGPDVPEALGIIAKEIMPLLVSSFPRGA